MYYINQNESNNTIYNKKKLYIDAGLENKKRRYIQKRFKKLTWSSMKHLRPKMVTASRRCVTRNKMTKTSC